MRLYIISGLGADDKVLEKLVFNPGVEPIHIPWLIPEKNETFQSYVSRMAADIDNSEPFYLLGYSFGGLMVQEIHKIKPATKVVILGSIRSDLEKSRLIKVGEKTNVIKFVPLSFFNHRNAVFYSFFRKLFDPKNPALLEYFRVTDPYYLKWSLEKISKWKFEKLQDVIQIMGNRDIVFPIKNSKPDYIVENGTHLFPLTKHREVSKILKTIFI